MLNAIIDYSLKALLGTATVLCGWACVEEIRSARAQYKVAKGTQKLLDLSGEMWDLYQKTLDSQMKDGGPDTASEPAA